MTVTNIVSRTVKTYTLTIEDGEVRTQPYVRAGAQYQVQRMEVVKQDGNLSSVKLAGSVLKKDGTAGKNWATESLYRHDAWPDWVLSMVAGLA